MAQASLSLSPILPPQYPGIARALAHLAARRAVKEQLRAKGVRLTTFPYAEIVAQAREYLAAHPELLNQAAETVQRSGADDSKPNTAQAIAERSV